MEIEKGERNLIHIPDHPGHFYADRDTQLSIETANEVMRLNANRPPEVVEIADVAISFDQEDHENYVRARAAISHAGKVEWPEDEDPEEVEDPSYVVVPQRTVEILGALGIQYEVLSKASQSG